jgi:hypothetical protein
MVGRIKQAADHLVRHRSGQKLPTNIPAAVDDFIESFTLDFRNGCVHY